MKNSIIPAVIFLLLLCSLPATAQDEEINVIRVRKKPLAMPDTSLPSPPYAVSGVSDWGPRPWLSDPFFSRAQRPMAVFIGTGYWKYTYLMIGASYTNRQAVITSCGVALEGCIDQEIYGAGIFGQRKIIQAGVSELSLGVRATGYSASSGRFAAAGPMVAWQSPYSCLWRFQLSYCYNFVVANGLRNPENPSARPLPAINTHHFSLTCSFPFYL
jgi:hypothetical protein